MARHRRSKPATVAAKPDAAVNASEGAPATVARAPAAYALTEDDWNDIDRALTTLINSRNPPELPGSKPSRKPGEPELKQLRDIAALVVRGAKIGTPYLWASDYDLALYFRQSADTERSYLSQTWSRFCLEAPIDIDTAVGRALDDEPAVLPVVHAGSLSLALCLLSHDLEAPLPHSAKARRIRIFSLLIVGADGRVLRPPKTFPATYDDLPPAGRLAPLAATPPESPDERYRQSLERVRLTLEKDGKTEAFKQAQKEEAVTGLRSELLLATAVDLRLASRRWPRITPRTAIELVLLAALLGTLVVRPDMARAAIIWWRDAIRHVARPKPSATTLLPSGTGRPLRGPDSHVRIGVPGLFGGTMDEWVEAQPARLYATFTPEWMPPLATSTASWNWQWRLMSGKRRVASTITDRPEVTFDLPPGVSAPFTSVRPIPVEIMDDGGITLEPDGIARGQERSDTLRERLESRSLGVIQHAVTIANGPDGRRHVIESLRMPTKGTLGSYGPPFVLIHATTKMLLGVQQGESDKWIFRAFAVVAFDAGTQELDQLRNDFSFTRDEFVELEPLAEFSYISTDPKTPTNGLVLYAAERRLSASPRPGDWEWQNDGLPRSHTAVSRFIYPNPGKPFMPRPR